MVRTGMIDHENFYSRMSRTIDALDNGTASDLISPASQSFDSWFETSDYAHPSTTSRFILPVLVLVC
ncbi:MAG: hypothetical protein R3B47_05570 [Bacteroidia bacterium]